MIGFRLEVEEEFQRAASTVSLSPTALVTATNVESRGFPLADRTQ